MRPVPLLLAVALFSVIHAASAQVPHNHPAIKLIDGAVNPELIPDSTAYRLFLLTVSTPPNPTDEQKKRQAAHLAKVGLGEKDLQALLPILSNFHVTYHELINSYNKAAMAAAAQGQRSDLNAFYKQRDQLVQSTHDAIKRGVSANAWDRFDIHIKGQKKRMRITSNEEAQ